MGDKIKVSVRSKVERKREPMGKSLRMNPLFLEKKEEMRGNDWRDREDYK